MPDGASGTGRLPTRWSRFTDACTRALAHLLQEDGDLVTRWRARLTACALLASLTLGSLPFFVTVRVLIAEGRGALVVLHIAALSMLWMMVVSRRIGARTRSAYLTGSCATVGTLAIVTMGFVSAGLVWLFASVLLAALLMSWRAMLGVLTYVLLLLAAVGIGIERDAFDWVQLSPFAASRWPMIALNFSFVVTICGGAISFAIHLLGKEDRARSAMEHRLAEVRRHEALGTLASGIAHDFNNLLVPLFSSIDELRRMPAPSAELRATLDDAAQGAALARDLVQRILAYARQTEVPRAPLVVAGEVRRALGLLRHRIPRDVSVTLSLDEDARVLATAVELHEIIANLVENALHAVGESGRLEVRLERTGAATSESPTSESPTSESPNSESPTSASPRAGGPTSVLLTVSDSGAGMDDATRERIFDPYFSTRAEGRGTGLGLPIVRSIVRGLGGSMDVRSAPGEGSAFFVSLPEVGGAQANTAEANAPAQDSASDIAARPRTVLLVDDEPAVRRSVGRLLTGLGYAVRDAADSQQAVTVLRGEAGATRDTVDIDVLLVDYRMPGESGVALSAAAQRLFPGIPTVVMSGDVEDARLDPEWQPRAVALQKPFSQQELALALENAIVAGGGVGSAPPVPADAMPPLSGPPRPRHSSRV